MTLRILSILAEPPVSCAGQTQPLNFSRILPQKTLFRDELREVTSGSYFSVVHLWGTQSQYYFLRQGYFLHLLSHLQKQIRLSVEC